MVKDVFAIKVITKYLEDVELVILIQVIMEVIVFVILDILEIGIIVKNVMRLVEDVQDQELINVYNVLM